MKKPKGGRRQGSQRRKRDEATAKPKGGRRQGSQRRKRDEATAKPKENTRRTGGTFGPVSGWEPGGGHFRKGVVVQKPGGLSRISFTELPPHETALPPGEVEIQVEAAGINFADIAVRRGLYRAIKAAGGYPAVPGFEWAGVVRSVGRDVQGFKIGDPVFGLRRFGSQASVIRVDGKNVFHRPVGMSAVEGAAFPAVALTAWYALKARLVTRPGDTVLVHSAAGGVGMGLCALAREMGARVIGVVGRPEKIPVVQGLGAESVFLRGPGLWRELDHSHPAGFDLILDAQGPSTLHPGWKRLKPGGVMVSYGFGDFFQRPGPGGILKMAWAFLRLPRWNPLAMHLANRSLFTFNLSYLFDESELLKAAMAELLELRARGKWDLGKPTVFPATEVREAHRALESGKTTGKLVLTFG